MQESVLDSSGNEYFSKETFPIQLYMEDNTVSYDGPGSWFFPERWNIDKEIVKNSNNEQVYLKKYEGKQLSITFNYSNDTNTSIEITAYSCKNIDVFENIAFRRVSNVGTGTEILSVNISNIETEKSFLAISLYVYVGKVSNMQKVSVTVTDIIISDN